MKTWLPGSICGQSGGVFVTVMLFDAVLLPMPFVTVTLTVYCPAAANTGAKMAPNVAPRKLAGCTLHEKLQPSPPGSPPDADATPNVHGGPPPVQSPLTTGSGPLSGCVSASALSRPAHAPPRGVGEVSVRRARMPRLVKELFAAVNGGTLPEPCGPVTRTLPAASMSCQRYSSAEACMAERMLVSLVVRTAAVNVTPLLDGAAATVAANGRTEYAAP